jgi:hypothetical protein
MPFKFIELPVELRDEIVQWTCDRVVLEELKEYVSYRYILNKMVYKYNSERLLIYGEVQGGKTREIIRYIKWSRDIMKVLVIQNSLLVLEQYKERLKQERVKFEVVSSKTRELKGGLIIVMGNSHRYKRFMELNKDRYDLILDEADLTIRTCPLRGSRTVYVTATPYKMGVKFDNILRAERSKKYQGFKEFKKVESNKIPMEDFKRTKTGIMLINRENLVSRMEELSEKLSRENEGVPIVLLTSERRIYMNGEAEVINKSRSITEIIDKLESKSHIVFVANRLSNRGLSYVSGDYQRVITHQVCKIQKDRSIFKQSLRMSGIKREGEICTLYIPESNKSERKRLEKHMKEE